MASARSNMVFVSIAAGASRNCRNLLESKKVRGQDPLRVKILQRLCCFPRRSRCSPQLKYHGIIS